GMSYEEFRKMARFGCNRCYEAFEGRLERLFKRIHGSSAHTGKRGARKNASEPVAVEELSRLKDQLQLAVATEDYEEAAQLRDRIRRLESDVEQAR
ncbi:MAG: UvrB/UvrC motif-containing protein, partial [Myxococcales bacterium]|nr:UvrB/UvrC motif-containing protein [Myxococcales bacterium]